MKRFIFLIISFVSALVVCAQQQTSFCSPAVNWEDRAITIFNDNFSAAFLGGVEQEVIKWEGITQRKGVSGVSTLPAGEIVLDFPGFKTAEYYMRELDSLTNIATTLITSHNLDVRRELFYSSRHHAFVVHLQVTPESTPLNFKVRLASKQGICAIPRAKTLILNEADSVACRAAMLLVKTDNEGVTVVERESLRVIGAREVTLYLVAGSRSIPPPKSSDRREMTAKRLHRDLFLGLKVASLRAYSKLKRSYCNKIAHSSFK